VLLAAGLLPFPYIEPKIKTIIFVIKDIFTSINKLIKHKNKNILIKIIKIK
jgi:hypothetical protein